MPYEKKIYKWLSKDTEILLKSECGNFYDFTFTIKKNINKKILAEFFKDVMMRNLFKLWAETDHNLLKILESESQDGREMLMQNFITYRL